MLARRVLLALLIVLLIGAFFVSDLGHMLDLDYLRAQRAVFAEHYTRHPLQSLGLFFGLYVLVTGLSLPGATILTLAAGALFGLVTGVILVSFASTLGATLAFLSARYVLRDAVQRRFARRLEAINAGVSRDGAYYLFTLRLIPLFPFFVINLVMGLTPIRLLVFCVVSQVGMLAGTVLYVNAGTQLGQLKDLEGILSLEILGSFALIGLFPWLAKLTLGRLKRGPGKVRAANDDSGARGPS